MIVGITGRARSGKDTAGDYIQSRYGIPKMSLAGPLKKAVTHMFGITQEMAEGSNYDRQQIVEPWGISVREMLQKLGTEGARRVFGDDFWTMRADIELSQKPGYYSKGFVMTDIRSDNEAQWVATKGGVVIKVERDLEGICNRHSSEKGVSPALVDHHIINNGTIPDFKSELRSILDEQCNKI